MSLVRYTAPCPLCITTQNKVLELQKELFESLVDKKQLTSELDHQTTWHRRMTRMLTDLLHVQYAQNPDAIGFYSARDGYPLTSRTYRFPRALEFRSSEGNRPTTYDADHDTDSEPLTGRSTRTAISLTPSQTRENMSSNESSDERQRRPSNAKIRQPKPNGYAQRFNLQNEANNNNIRRNNSSNATIQNLEAKVRFLEEDLKKMQSKFVATDQKRKVLEAEIQQEQEHKQNQKDQFDQRLGASQDEIARLKKEIVNGKAAHKAAQDEANKAMKEMSNELAVTKSRLSKIMGDRLTDNNPDIANLGDKYRPTVLADLYSELYDNEWTDALAVLASDDDLRAFHMLKHILREAMAFCEMEAGTQLNGLLEFAVLSSDHDKSVVPRGVKKSLKDLRRETAPMSLRYVMEKFRSSLRRSTSEVATAALQVPIFSEKCVTVCWFMSVQDPPVVLAEDSFHGNRFRGDIYRVYTSSGPSIDYVVWPALLLHEDGPILCKGVAEGCVGNAH